MLLSAELSLASVARLSVLVTLVYIFSLISYRLFLSPLRKFPGPWLAAATYWYEFYYDIVLGGQYTFRIAQLHQQYGPVVRINPHELHVHDLEFYDQLYAGGGKRRHKWYRASRAFGADASTFATELHDVHKVRRAALNPFFSMTRVRKLEPVIRNRAEAVMNRVREFRINGSVLTLDVMFGAYSADVIMDYAFGRCGHKIEAPDFDNDFHEACVNGGKQLFLTRQFPLLLTLIKIIPPKAMLKMNPSMASFFAMHRDIAVQARTLYEEGPASHDSKGQTTVFHEILNSKLPEHEKTFTRLATDGGALVGAGTVTTAWAITTAVFYLLRDADCLTKLKQELEGNAVLISSEQGSLQATLPALENLQYLSAVIQEALRLSYGVASRLARIAPDEALRVRKDPLIDGKVPLSEEQWSIPPGTPVSMTQLLIFQDERIFPSAAEFRPERWIQDRRLDRYQVAFSKGSRICVGKNLAMAELYIILAMLFSSYGSKKVRFSNDVGYLDLWETDESDVECAIDAFVPLPKAESKGVRCKVFPWET